MSSRLPARPDLDHLRRQSKQLLAALRAGDPDAAREFREHLPAARGRSVAQVFAAEYRLADAQSVVARRSGFASWPGLGRHVTQLRALEGEWGFEQLEMAGMTLPAAALTASRLLIDGDRFAMESPEANYEGVFTIDVERDPAQMDIDFVAGPEAGHRSHAIFRFDGDDRLTMCVGLTGAARPLAFASAPGSRHALERLRRLSAARPVGGTGGDVTCAEDAARAEDAATAGAVIDPTDPGFDAAMTPLLERLQGKWAATELVRDGQALPSMMLRMGSRTCTGRETRVTFGGQVFLHAKLRLDETTSPVRVDYLHSAGAAAGRVSAGLMQWQGDEVQFVMAPPGEPVPADFECPRGSGRTLSRWKRS